jgi:hypothetical protein
LRTTMKKLAPDIERSIREARLGRLQLAMAFEHEGQTKRPIPTCRKGCHHCCYHPVQMSVLEGIGLYRWLVDNMLWSHDRQEAFKNVAKQTWGQSLDVWTLSMIQCPLLVDDLCVAYKRRPFVCRITISTGDPHYCHPHRINENLAIVPRKEWMERLEAMEATFLRRHKLSYVYIPLAVAVLYGEKVSKENIDLREVDMNLLFDSMRGG